MKVKKIFVLSILTVMMTMFFTGCSYSITKMLNKHERIAEEFLKTKDYVPPEGYEVRYIDESEKQLLVNTKETEIIFNVSEGELEMVSISISTTLKDVIEQMKESIFSICMWIVFVCVILIIVIRSIPSTKG